LGGGWTGWRGPNRDARVPHLPSRLPDKPNIVWRARFAGKALGGVAATDGYIIASGRDIADTSDIFRCYKADTGAEVWTVYHLAPGKLDFGSSPRATPLIQDGHVFLFGAFGHLQCVDLATGAVVWEKEIKDEFPPAEAPTWGYCGSPLIVGGRLIVSAGAHDATLAALDPKTGACLWKGAGDATGYGSFIAAELGGKVQIVGHDKTTLGGWDAGTGHRLWTLTPPRPKDFNVPTPIVYNGQIIVATENNGTRLYRFRPDGTIDPTPAGDYQPLKPDTHTPVITRDRLFGVWADRLHCLDLANNLKPLWQGEDKMFGAFTMLIASEDRLLAVGMDSELLLIDAAAAKFTPLGRLTLIDDEAGVYAHPAFVGNRLYYRGGGSVLCVDLGS
jgi:outer membrane protein assembly factor BamB